MVEKPGHCPHLGLKQNRAIRFASPTPEHRCYVTGEAQDIPVDQASYCLSQDHIKCPLYTGSSVPTMPAVQTSASLSQGGVRGWLATLSPRDRTIYAVLLSFMVVIISVYLLLGTQLILHDNGTPDEPTAAPVAVVGRTPLVQETSRPHTPTTLPAAGGEVTSRPRPIFLPNNLLRDSSFETGTPNIAWTEVPTNTTSPICSATRCEGTGPGYGPYSGDFWVWFGGDQSDSSSISQKVTIPPGSATLSFWLEILEPPAAAQDVFQVAIDDAPVVEVTSSDAAKFATYAQVTQDVSRYADGGTHTLQFSLRSSDKESKATTFFLDDVALVMTRPSLLTPVATLDPLVLSPTILPSPVLPLPVLPSPVPSSPVPVPSSDVAASQGHQLYFADASGTLLIPISRQITTEPRQLAEALVQELLAGPRAGMSLRGLLSPESTLLTVERSESTLRVNFDRTPGDDLALLSLALTLTELPGVNQVQVQVNGENIGLAEGRNPIPRPSPNIYNPENLPETFASGTRFLPLYFLSDGYFVRVTRLIPKTQSIGRATVEQLLAGPAIYADRLTSPIPAGTTLRGIRKDGRRAIVDLTQPFADTPQPARSAALNTLVLSLTELQDEQRNAFFDEVEVLVEGSKLADYWGSKYDHPFQRPPLNPE